MNVEKKTDKSSNCEFQTEWKKKTNKNKVECDDDWLVCMCVSGVYYKLVDRYVTQTESNIFRATEQNRGEIESLWHFTIFWMQ